MIPLNVNLYENGIINTFTEYIDFPLKTAYLWVSIWGRSENKHKNCKASHS